jgi:hypothetical protein
MLSWTMCAQVLGFWFKASQGQSLVESNTPSLRIQPWLAPPGGVGDAVLPVKRPSPSPPLPASAVPKFSWSHVSDFWKYDSIKLLVFLVYLAYITAVCC